MNPEKYKRVIIQLREGHSVLADINHRKRCRFCRGIIYWAVNESGKKIPINRYFDFGQWELHFSSCPKMVFEKK